MTVFDERSGRAVISNDALRLTIDTSGGLKIEELFNIPGNKAFVRDQELFMLRMRGKTLRSSDAEKTEISVSEDKAFEMISITEGFPSEKLSVRISVINDRGRTISILYQVRDGYLTGVQTRTELFIPVIAALNGGEGQRKYYPGCAVSDSRGRQVLKPMRESLYSSDILMPLAVCDRDDRYGICVEFPTMSDLNNIGATQNVNKLLTGISNEEQLQDHWVEINPDDSYNDTAEIRMSGLEGGWPEAFRTVRDGWRKKYDFSEYSREDLKWFNKCVVHNFTFLYGKEAFDHEKKQIDTDKLIGDGRKFGGYDTVTIWNQYPRLGIDRRSQWDFYDDFPGGRAAIREAVRKMHEQGIYVFLPYIPWDQANSSSVDEMGDEFARIIKDTDADGYQLDTLIDLPYSFRKKLDEVRPGLVLTTQHHPAKKHPTEFITTSWDEFWRTEPMPEADVFRFMCPEHLAPVISRWLRTEDKSLLIKRAEFGAAPIVIWQDIFGRWMPYTDEQKAEIKRWKEVYLKYREIYQGNDPIPLVPTFTENVYCNSFSNAGSVDIIYSFYNDSDTEVTLDEFRTARPAVECSVILGGGYCRCAKDGISLDLGPHEVKHVLVRS